MKKSLFSLMLLTGVSYGADVTLYQSTYSATSQFDRALCTGTRRGYLHKICVVDTVAGSTVAVFNSTFSVADVQAASVKNLSGVIDGSEARGCLEYALPAPRGLYVDQFGTAGVVIEYECYGD